MHANSNKITFQGSRWIKEASNPYAASRLQYEQELVQSLCHEGILPIETVDHDATTLKYSPFIGESLDKLISSQALSLEKKLKIAISIAQTLAYLQNEGFVILTIDSQNIIVNSDTCETKLINLDHLLKLEKINLSFNEVFYISNPHFMAPETTGRINRGVDFKSDIYSFGVVLFQLFELKLPFEGHNDLEVMYGHIAKTLPEFYQENTTLIKSIIKKCLEKEPQNRYQSFEGIIHDLSYHLEHINDTAMDKDFKVAARDSYSQFSLTKKLHGKSVQIRQLFESFEDCFAGQSQFILVGGESGIGKTLFVKDLSKDLFMHQGVCLTTKFTQLHRSVPFSALRQIAADLIKQAVFLLSKNKNLTEEQGTLNDYICDLYSLLPDLELPHISHQDQDRSTLPFDFQFVRLVDFFLETFQTPLILFIDDLQWADKAAIDLLQLTLFSQPNKKLMIIGAYRDNEVSSLHPINFMLKRFEEDEMQYKIISLSPWGQLEIQDYLLDSFYNRIENPKRLAQFIIQKTFGNPFYIRKLLEQLHEANILVFNPEKNGWQWNETKLNALNVAENVLGFVLDSIKKSDANTLVILKLAAVLGHRFNAAMVTAISKLSRYDVAATVQKLFSEGVLIAENTAFLFANIASIQNNLEELNLRFAHDKYFHAAMELLDGEDRNQLHLAVGEFLFKEQTNEANTIPQYLAHFNQSELRSVLLDDVKLAELNLKAGKISKNSGGFELANDFFEKGVSYLETYNWQETYQLQYDLQLNLGISYYLINDLKSAESCINVLLENANSALDKARALSHLIVQYTTIGDYITAIKTGNKALKLLKMAPLSLHPSTLSLVLNILLIFSLKGRKKIEDLVNLRRLDEPRFALAMDIYNNLGPPAFFVDQNLMSIVQLRMVKMSLKNGNNEISAYSYSTFGIVLGPAIGFYKTAHDFSKLALAVSKKYFDKQIYGRIEFIISTFISNWVEPLQVGLDRAQKAFQALEEEGDFIWAGYSLCQMAYAGFSLGHNLKTLSDTIEDYRQYAIKTKHKDIQYDFEVIQDFVEKIRGNKPIKPFKETYTEKDEWIYTIKHLNRQVSHHEFLVLCQMLYYFHDHIEDAFKAGKESKKYMQSSVGFVYTFEHYFFNFLVMARAYASQSFIKKKWHRIQLKLILLKFKTWSKLSPDTFGIRYQLLKAEYAQLFGSEKETEKYFDELNLQLKSLDNYLLKSVGYHSLSHFISKNSKAHETVVFRLSESLQQWGANGVDDHIKYLYPHYFEYDINDDHKKSEIDYKSVIQTTQLLSREMDSQVLFEKSADILIKTAGATRGALVLINEDKQIEKTIDLSPKKQLTQVHFEVPTQLIYQAIQSQDTVCINDCTDSQLITLSPKYMRQYDPRSVLVLPLQNNIGVNGVVYLENNQISKAFSQERIEALLLIASQLSISLENVSIFTEMKKKNLNLGNAIETQRSEIEEKRKIEKDLKLAKEVQQRMLPESFPDMDGLHFDSLFQPAKAVSGDYYDFFQFSENEVGVVISDIVGKGISASLSMVNLKNIVHQHICADDSPKDVITKLNKVIFETRSVEKYVPIIYLKINLKEKTFTYVNAGHESGYFFNGKAKPLDIGGCPLGMDEDELYEEETIKFKESDLLLLFTDGLTDARNVDEEEFGLERVISTVEGHKDAMKEDSHHFMPFLKETVKTFTAHTQTQKDDITVLSVEF